MLIMPFEQNERLRCIMSNTHIQYLLRKIHVNKFLKLKRKSQGTLGVEFYVRLCEFLLLPLKVQLHAHWVDRSL